MKKIISTAVAVLMLSSTASNANVIDHPDVNGLKTFQDTTTGNVWLDMDNFFDPTANIGTTGYDMISIAQNAGFTFANLNQVHSLLDTLPLTDNNWLSYANVMGYGHPRQLIWGMYDDSTGNPYGWAFSFSTDNTWHYQDDSTNANWVQNFNYGRTGVNAVDLGIWAFKSGSTNVPEPSSLLLLAIGLIGCGLSRKKHS